MKPIPAMLTAPWAVEPQWLQAAFAVWSRGAVESVALAKARAEWQEREKHKVSTEEPGAPIEGTGGTLRIVGDVGVVSIQGALFRHANMMSDFSGGTTYDSLWRALEVCRASPAVQSIVLKINSPGGELDGLNELAGYVAQLAGEKPVTAYADCLCASAAYWIASQARRILAEETCQIGSIGVRSGITDYSKRNEMMGVRDIEIVSSASPGKRATPVDDDVIGRIQTRVDDSAAIFVAAVAAGRAVSAEKVLEDFGQGDVMIASKALAAGMVDEIGTFATALGTFSTRTGATMAIDKTPVAAVADEGKSGEWPCAGCKEMMGPSAAAYCSKCAEEDEPDGDEEEGAKALMSALGVESFAAAVAHIESLKASHAAVGELRQQLAALQIEGIKRDLRAVLDTGLSSGKLSPGKVQKSMALVLRGQTKAAWVAAMGDLKEVTRDALLTAACSVSGLTAEDVTALGDYARQTEPVAAAAFDEPPRDADAEAQEMDAASQRIAQYAAEIRAKEDARAAKAKANRK